ncbi:hypothetical protein [Mycetocola reblochoni]|uniref:Serine protease, subtilase family n=2 Tax=Mycetocola reblochoni TaxID=331618 RepID=A0A1R4KBB3_9MICO|nr:hypothetical protein [Mycetocola reblochoni]RLP69244.1 hypothetical protein D9V30_07985 [Mycetocola reblochoni]SJN41606.1 Serine protease, subtilase family [Mycetocola reblochoni REB411]
MSALEQGGGIVDPLAMLEPGLVVDAGEQDWDAYRAGLGLLEEAELADGQSAVSASELNLPSVAVGDLTDERTVRRTLTATTAGTYRFDTEQPAGFRLAVEPATAILDEGQSVTVSLSLARTDAAFDDSRTGAIRWEGPKGIRGALPVAATAVAASSPPRVSAPTGEGSTTVPVRLSDGVAVESQRSAVTPLTPVRPTGADTDAATASGAAGTVTDTPIAVPRGIMAGRLALRSVAPGVSARIELYRLNDLAEPVMSWSADAEGIIDVPSPPAGRYVLRTVIESGTGDVLVEQAWAAADDGDDDGGAEGPALRVDTSDLGAGPASERSVGVTWSGVSRTERYVAAVRFGDDGPLTLVALDPAPTG